MLGVTQAARGTTFLNHRTVLTSLSQVTFLSFLLKRLIHSLLSVRRTILRQVTQQVQGCSSRLIDAKFRHLNCISCIPGCKGQSSEMQRDVSADSEHTLTCLISLGSSVFPWTFLRALIDLHLIQILLCC